MIDVICGVCGRSMNEPGGLVFSPPDENDRVTKGHVCVTCWRRIFEERIVVRSSVPAEFIVDGQVKIREGGLPLMIDGREQVGWIDYAVVEERSVVFSGSVTNPGLLGVLTGVLRVSVVAEGDRLKRLDLGTLED